MVNITQLQLFDASTWGVLLPVVAWVASVFTFVYSMIIFFKTFTGKVKPYLLPKNRMKRHSDYFYHRLFYRFSWLVLVSSLI